MKDLPALDDAVPRKYRRHVVQMVTLLWLVVGFGYFASSASGAWLMLWDATRPLLFISLSFYAAWWGFCPYESADMDKLFRAVHAGNRAAAPALFVKPLIFGFCALTMVLGTRSANAAGVPPQAQQYLPVLQREIQVLWPDMPERAYIAALVHHESGCPGLRSCWSPKARLKTQREEGGGLPQLTRAWRADGSLRFDVVADLRRQHAELRELSWDNLYSRPDLQLRAMVIMLHETAVRFADIPAPARLDFVDAAYNGGAGGVRQEQRLCKAAGACDPFVWWGHVERHCSKSTAPLYGRRSACDINRDHVRLVRREAQPLYEPLMRRAASLGVVG